MVASNQSTTAWRTVLVKHLLSMARVVTSGPTTQSKGGMKMGSQRYLGLLIVVTTALLFSAACQSEPEVIRETVVVTTAVEVTVEVPVKETTFERAKREGTIRIGAINQHPWSVLQEDGTITGMSPDVAKAVFQEIGIPDASPVIIDWAALIPSLQASRLDLIAAGMYILPERCEQAAFSNPNFCVGSAMIVKAGNPFNMHSYEDVAADSKVRFGCVAGAAECTYARQVNVAESQISEFPTQPDAVSAVQSGRIDVYAGNSLGARSLLEELNDSNIEEALPFTDPIIDGKTARGCGGFAFRKEDADLVAAFNTGLEKLIKSDKVLEIMKSYGFTEQEMADLPTAEELCK